MKLHGFKNERKPLSVIFQWKIRLHKNLLNNDELILTDMLEYTIDNLLLQTGIFVEELQFKPELGDFISSKCSAVELFHQKVSFEKDASLSHVWNTASAKCTLCSDEIKVESVVDLYEHLFEKHIKNFIKCMVLSDLMVDNVIEKDIKYVKEEVKAIVVITNCMVFGRGVSTGRVIYMIKKKAREIVSNRLDCKVFANEDVLWSLMNKIENYLQEPIVPW